MDREQLLFVQLMEECSEVQKICSKIIRFGASDFHPNTRNVPNARLLKEELNDMFAILELLRDNYGLDIDRDDEFIANKKLKIDRYYEYSKNLGKVL